MATSSRPTSSASTGRAPGHRSWLDRVNSFTDNQIAAFDFPLRYKLKDVCDTLNYDLRNLTDGGSIVMKRPLHAATFVDNHDMGDNTIVNDKLMAYSFIMVHEGYPASSGTTTTTMGSPGRHAQRHRRVDPGAPSTTPAATRRSCTPTPTSTSCSASATRTTTPTSPA